MKRPTAGASAARSIAREDRRECAERASGSAAPAEPDRVMAGLRRGSRSGPLFGGRIRPRPRARSCATIPSTICAPGRLRMAINTVGVIGCGSWGRASHRCPRRRISDHVVEANRRCSTRPRRHPQEPGGARRQGPDRRAREERDARPAQGRDRTGRAQGLRPRDRGHHREPGAQERDLRQARPDLPAPRAPRVQHVVVQHHRDGRRDQACRDRCSGLHFFNPVPLMKLVEVVQTILTDEQDRADGVRVGAGGRQGARRAKDSTAFIVNRLLVPYLLDAIRIYEGGLASLEDIDQAMKLGCGYPMGPFTLLDLVGLDTTMYVAEVMFEEFREPRYAPPPLLKRMVMAGHLGRKSGKGFYDYRGGRSPAARDRREGPRRQREVEDMNQLYYLSDEQRAIRDLAREIARERIAPRAAHVDETGEYPHEQLKLLGQQGLMGLHIPEEYGGSRCGRARLLPRRRGGGVGVRRHLDDLPGAEPRRLSHLARRQRRAEAPLPAAAGDGRDHGRLLALRVRAPAPMRRPAVRGRAHGRPLRRQRLQDVGDQRLARGRHHRVRDHRPEQARPGRDGAARRAGDEGIQRRQEREEAGHPRLADRGAALLRLRGARGEPARRRRRGLQDRA